MANGGTTGDDLERLRVQVDATRTELGEVAGAVSGLSDLVTDLIRRSAGSADHAAEKWQARLGSLETRLEMLETSIRVEVERIRATAGAVDALADDFKTTVGGTHNLVDLAANIGDRIATLETLERSVRGAAQDIATSVEARLDRDSSDRLQHEDSIAERVSTVIAQTQDGLAALTAQLKSAAEITAGRTQDGLAALTARLDAVAEVTVEQTRESLATMAARLDDIVRATGDLPSLEDRLSAQLRDASTELRALGARIDEATEGDDRLQEIAGAVAQVRAHQPQLTVRLDQLASELADIQSSLAQPDESLGALGERLDSLAAAMRQVVASQPDPRPQLEQLAAVVEAVRSGQPDMAAFVEAVRSGQPDMAAFVEAVRSGQPDVTEQVDRLSTQLAAVVEAVRSGQPDMATFVEVAAERGLSSSPRSSRPFERDNPTCPSRSSACRRNSRLEAGSGNRMTFSRQHRLERAV